jgi:hypothetical protein
MDQTRRTIDCVCSTVPYLYYFVSTMQAVPFVRGFAFGPAGKSVVAPHVQQARLKSQNGSKLGSEWNASPWIAG